MFTGSIQGPQRSIVAEVASTWSGLPVYVGCSGNFTIEQILVEHGVRTIHSNDVSLYSSVIGEMLCGRLLPVEVVDDDYAWLRERMRTPEDLAATMILCLEHLPNAVKAKRNPYARWLWEAARENWTNLHRATVEVVKSVKDRVRLSSYFAGDVVDFILQVPRECACIAFPPTYKGGYERMYRPLEQVFRWQAPSYTQFDEARFAVLIEAMTSKREWLLSFDRPLEQLADYIIARTQNSLKSHPVWVYGSHGRSRLVAARTTMKPIRIDRVRPEDADGEIGLMEVSPSEYAYLREQYLCKAIAASTAQYPLLVTLNRRLAGVLAFSKPMGGETWYEAYLWCDFVPDGVEIPRLSKLVIMAALSQEVAEWLTQKLVRRVRTIGTTVYTEKPVSMKYRGVFELRKREKGRLLYAGRASRWTLAQALQQWQARYRS